MYFHFSWYYRCFVKFKLKFVKKMSMRRPIFIINKQICFVEAGFHVFPGNWSKTRFSLPGWCMVYRGEGYNNNNNNDNVSGGRSLWQNRFSYYSVLGVRWDEEKETQT